MEAIGPYIKRVWLLEHQILAYKIQAIDLNILMKWSEDIIEQLKEWPDSQPLLLLYDLSAQGVALPYLVMSRHNIFNIGITESGEQKIKQLFQENPDMHGCLAVVLSSSASGHITQRFAGGMPTIESEIFFEYDAALQWLIDWKLKITG